jgi:ribonuclease HI
VIYEKALNIYALGSSSTRTRRGGIGLRYVTIDVNGNELFEDDSILGKKGATKHEMGLLACIEGLKGALEHPKMSVSERIYLNTDVQYITENVGRAKFEWSKRKWLGRDGRLVENADLWKELVRLIRSVPKPVEFKWVPKHAKDPHQKVAERLARMSAGAALD